MLFVLPSYIFDLYGHGKLDLMFVHGRAVKKVGSNKVFQKRCTYLRPKSPRKIMVCLFRIHLLR